MRNASIGLLLLLVWPAVAAAEGGGAAAVAEGRRLAQEARFGEAMAAFARASASTGLSRDDLVALLEGQAMVHHAQGDDASFTRIASGLASIAPDYAPSRRIPPRLARRLRAATAEGTPLSLDANGERGDGAVTITAEVRGDEGALVTRVRVMAKVGGGDYGDPHTAPATIDAGPTEAVRYFVEAVGPGGVVLASVGTADGPEVMPVEEAPPPHAVVGAQTATAAGETEGSEGDSGLPPNAETEEDDDGLPVWPFVVGGVVLVAVVAIVLAALLIPGSNTSPGLPSIPL